MSDVRVQLLVEDGFVVRQADLVAPPRPPTHTVLTVGLIKRAAKLTAFTSLSLPPPTPHALLISLYLAEAACCKNMCLP